MGSNVELKTKGDGVKAGEKAIASYQKQIDKLSEEQDVQKKAHSEIEDTFQEALEQMASVALPDTSDENLEAAAELFGAAHLKEVVQRAESRLEKFVLEVKKLEADEEFQQADNAIDAQTGSLSLDLQNVEETIAEHQEALKRYDFTAFWAMQEFQKTKGSTSPGFMDYVTFRFSRINKLRKEVMETLQVDSPEEALQDHEDLKASLSELNTRKSELEIHISRIKNKVQKHEKATEALADREAFQRQEARKALAKHLEFTDFRLFFDKAPEALRIYLAKLDALTQKKKYLGQSIEALQEQINDRQTKINGILKVLPVWKRKPYAKLSGDKTKWLVKLPERKRQSTNKYVSNSHKLYLGVYDYDDYDEYETFLVAGAAFIAYDAFANASGDMPYDGFAQNTLGEVAEFREEHGQSELPEAESAAEAAAVDELAEGGEDFESGDVS